MLFNSYVFIFAFLPITVAGYVLLVRLRPHRVATAWVVACSLFYYGYWDFSYVSLIVFSILFNYGAGLVPCHW